VTVPRRVLPAVLTGEDGSVSRVGPPDPLRGRNNQYTVPDGRGRNNQYTVPDGRPRWPVPDGPGPTGPLGTHGS